MDVTELGEIRAVPLSPHITHQISGVAFSHTHDLLWAGTEEGYLYSLEVPSGVRYSSVKGHDRAVRDLAPVNASRDGGLLTVSNDSIAYRKAGGLTQFNLCGPQLKDLTCCNANAMSPAMTGIVGQYSGNVCTVDLATGKLSPPVGPIAEGIQIIKGGDPHGYTAFGTASGQVCLADSRQSFKVQQLLPAHAGGLVGMDLAGGLLASCGKGTRQGQLVPDTIIKVYDLRSTAKVMTTVSFAPGPSFVKFHPRYMDVLYISSSTGRFTAAKLHSTQYAPIQQVDTGGGSMTGMDISTSGEAVAFGTTSGYVHLLAFNSQPRISFASGPLERPDRPQRDLSKPPLHEGEPFSTLLPYYPVEGRLLSDWDLHLGKKGLAPRTVSPEFLSSGKTVDFVTYVENPYKHLPKPEANRKIAALRNTRMVPSYQNNASDLAERQLIAKRQSALPYKYRRVHITVDQERKFQEFNFSKHNKTRFAGLENGIANCYANAVVQVMYFLPQMREYFLQAVPDAAKEFSLLDELALLFRMLASESGHACQATNLLRALRQAREAGGLGLLEGHASGGQSGTDIEVEANKEKLLSRRVQNLQRFLLDKLHNEMSQRQKDLAKAGTGDLSQSQAVSKTKIEEVFAMSMKQHMQSLQASKAKSEKDISVFQVDLRYGSAKSATNKGRPSSPEPNAPSQSDSSQSSSLKRPFSDVLASSLRAEDETRAWFNDQLQYQFVKRSRTPTTLPQVLALGTNIHDAASIASWKDVEELGEEVPSASHSSWLPTSIAIDQSNGDFNVVQATSDELPACPDGWTRTAYSLTAAISLVHEEAPFGQQAGSSRVEEGHLVAHVRVPISYLDDRMSINPTPRAKPASPGFTPSNRFRPSRPSTSGAAPVFDLRSTLGEAGGTAGAASAPADDFGLPDDPFGEALRPSITSGASADGSPEGRLQAMAAELSETDDELQASTLGLSEAEESGTETDRLEDLPHSVTSPDSLSAAAIPEQFSNLKVSARRSGSWATGSYMNEPVWLLINDFAISKLHPEEVVDIYQGHKLPCLLYYMQEPLMQSQSRQSYKIQPAPVLGSEAGNDFHALCKQPPLQSTLFTTSRVTNATFIPLEPSEGPSPGQLLALDAEFVAFSPPTKSYSRGKEIETAPSRLGLARVSVIRGEGPQAETACIDDYIRATEPVTDYLTQYSGLQPGDLDPSMSRHHLTTMKAAYLKLRYLVDIGCVFVGHGLKKDFRMINLVVPPSQVIDTVDLFYLKRQRKLSLRFLAAYLLKCNIQRVTHDSIEDARTALQLFKLYRKLGEEGRIQDVIQELYAFGKLNGWDPTAVSVQGQAKQ